MQFWPRYTFVARILPQNLLLTFYDFPPWIWDDCSMRLPHVDMLRLFFVRKGCISWFKLNCFCPIVIPSEAVPEYFWLCDIPWFAPKVANLTVSSYFPLLARQCAAAAVLWCCVVYGPCTERAVPWSRFLIPIRIRTAKGCGIVALSLSFRGRTSQICFSTEKQTIGSNDA